MVGISFEELKNNTSLKILPDEIVYYIWQLKQFDIIKRVLLTHDASRRLREEEIMNVLREEEEEERRREEEEERRIVEEWFRQIEYRNVLRWKLLSKRMNLFNLFKE